MSAERHDASGKKRCPVCRGKGYGISPDVTAASTVDCSICDGVGTLHASPLKCSRCDMRMCACWCHIHAPKRRRSSLNWFHKDDYCINPLHEVDTKWPCRTLDAGAGA